MIRVVLADDHPVVRSGIRNELQAAGIEVVGEAADGKLALQLTEQLVPDVLVLDIELPGLNGVEVTQRLRETLPQVRILVLSAYDYASYVFGLLEAGAIGYVLKDEALGNIITAVTVAARGESWLSPRIAQKVIQRAVGQQGPDSAAFTERELDVLRLIASGMDNQAIAEKLYLSERTVKYHISHIYEKLGVTTRAEIVLWAVQQGFVTR